MGLLRVLTEVAVSLADLRPAHREWFERYAADETALLPDHAPPPGAVRPPTGRSSTPPT
jgi:hypothetical protein